MEKILEELYASDPELKKHEKVLKVLLKELLVAKPDIELSESFKAELREKVWARIDEIKDAPRVKWPIFAFAGAAVFAVIMVPVIYFAGLEKPIVSFGEFKIESVSENAFGSLSGDGFSAEDAALSSTDAGRGGGMISEEKAAVSDEDASIEPYYDDYYYPYYSYTYAGDELTFSADSVEVLKRKKDTSLSKQLGSMFADIDFGLMDLSKLGDFELSNIQLSPPSGEGYSVYADFANSEISISYWDPNMWNYWESVTSMPPDDVLIAVADDFINKTGISLQGHGEAEVNHYDDEYYYYDGWVPDYVDVVYPLEIDGKHVYSEWGGKMGITATVYIPDMLVSYVYGIKSHVYESSSYEAASIEDILAAAEEGGVDGWYRYDWVYDENTVFELDTPALEYMQHWVYDDNESFEVYVPAYVFPVIGSDDYVVVPLASEIMQSWWWDYPDEPVLYEEEI